MGGKGREGKRQKGAERGRERSGRGPATAGPPKGAAGENLAGPLWDLADFGPFCLVEGGSVPDLGVFGPAP